MSRLLSFSSRLRLKVFLGPLPRDSNLICGFFAVPANEISIAAEVLDPDSLLETLGTLRTGVFGPFCCHPNGSIFMETPPVGVPGLKRAEGVPGLKKAEGEGNTPVPMLINGGYIIDAEVPNGLEPGMGVKGWLVLAGLPAAGGLKEAPDGLLYIFTSFFLRGT